MILKYGITTAAKVDVDLEPIGSLTNLQALFQQDDPNVVYTSPDEDHGGQLLTLEQLRNVVVGYN